MRVSTTNVEKTIYASGQRNIVASNKRRYTTGNQRLVAEADIICPQSYMVAIIAQKS